MLNETNKELAKITITYSDGSTSVYTKGVVISLTDNKTYTTAMVEMCKCAIRDFKHCTETMNKAYEELKNDKSEDIVKLLLTMSKLLGVDVPEDLRKSLEKEKAKKEDQPINYADIEKFFNSLKD